MADVRTRRTGEHNTVIIKLMADARAMQDRVDALEGRMLRLETELASSRKASVKPATSAAPRPASRRPAPGGPPPLPPLIPGMPMLPRSVGRKSIVDISEIAELVESVPPPAPRSKR